MVAAVPEKKDTLSLVGRGRGIIPRKRHSLPRTRVSPSEALATQRERDGITVGQTELGAQMGLAEQLDLVGRIAGPARLDGLEGEAAVPTGDRDVCQEVTRLARSRLPVGRDLLGGDVPPARAAFER